MEPGSVRLLLPIMFLVIPIFGGPLGEVFGYGDRTSPPFDGENLSDAAN
jgi:hypothetical protein